jgi:hypothetical protein
MAAMLLVMGYVVFQTLLAEGFFGLEKQIGLGSNTPLDGLSGPYVESRSELKPLSHYL